MREYYPLLIIGASVSVFALIFILAYVFMKDKKAAIGFDRNMKDSEITRRLLIYAKPHIGSFAAVGLVMILSIAYDIVSPLIVGRIEEMIKGKFPLPRLFAMVAVYAGILIVSLICTYIQSIVLQKTGQKIMSQIRYDLFCHIESLSHAQLSEIPTGKLVTRVTNDTNSVSMMFTNIFVNLAKNALIIIGVLVAMLTVNYELTLMVLCFVPYIVIFTLIFRKFSRRAYRRVKDRTTDINTFLSENLSGMKIIRIFNRQAQKKNEFDLKNEELGRAKRDEIFVFSIFRPVVYMLYISSVLALLYLCGRGYIKETVFLGQTITSGTLVTFYMYISTFFNPIQSLAEQFNWLQSAFASAEKIFTIMDIVPGVSDDEDAVDIDADGHQVKGSIEFQHVWFAYEGENWIIRDLSFKVEAGQTVALVGHTGSGKTTILSLLCRNYDIQKGKILIDGVDIRHYTISSLRRQFGQMLQDVFLFSGTVRSNIALHDEVSDDEINAACRYVNADSFINKLEKGLDDEVRERGNNFSAGQRQLISFARTVLKKPKIMILDEATANIDTETERLIQDSLEKMMNIGTMLMVAHRLSTIQHADKIIVMASGKIVEQGTHEELLELKGKYYGLYMLQYDKQRLSAE
ncbi:MAG: ABC transporter ATP-binding protein/permease [Clostridia bacterium]|nr:ABC transporter ATP-binding protein/permease [Clostridia bacterium]